MISKKNTIIILAIGLIFVAAIGFSFNDNEAKMVETINMHADLAKEYTSVEDLKKDSKIIAEVRAFEVNSFEYKNVVFTLTKADVINVYKGEEIESLKILETGGKQDNINYAFNGNKVFEKNDTSLVFLDKYIGPIADDAYVVLGVYQGKFNTNGDKITLPNEVKGELKNITSISDFEL